MTKNSRFPQCGYSRTVQYNSSSNWEVLFQVNGSIWKKVLPHCALTVSITLIVRYLRKNAIVDLTLSEYGHEFLAFIVGYFLVSRCTKTFDVYFEFRQYLDATLASTRELVQVSCALSSAGKAQVEWRRDVSYYAIILLRVVAAMLTRFNDGGINTWEVPELNSLERELLLVSLEEPSVVFKDESKLRPSPEPKWRHGYHTDSDENLRTPICLANVLRQKITSHRDRDFKKGSLDSIQEQTLLRYVDEFMKGYYGLRKYLTTPFPFPLVQLEHTFLFFYVYTMPFALVNVFDTYIQNVVMVFIATYGFVGIHAVSDQLDDPFGTEPSDLPVMGEVRSVIEDVLLSIMAKDGLEAVRRLRERLDRREGDSLTDSFYHAITSRQQALEESTPLLF